MLPTAYSARMPLLQCPACGWMVSHDAPSCPGCGKPGVQPVPPGPNPRGAGSNVLAFIGFCLMAYTAWFLYGLYNAHGSDVQRAAVGSAADPKFCSEWLHYYETFCTAYPAKCTEGPRKLARCDQGWDKP